MSSDAASGTKIPLVIAHRGASEDAPEHTLEAYRMGLDQGADGVECDVRLTADRHLVCVHDRKADRTSTGKGVVSTMDLAQLNEFNWASWKKEFGDLGLSTPDQDAERGKLLTLRRLLEVLNAEKRELLSLIETKHPTRYGGLVERQLVKVLREFGLTSGDLPGMPHVRVMSFSHLALVRMRQLAPKVPLVYLVERGAPAWTWDGSLPKGVNTVGLDMRIVRTQPKTVRAHQRRGNTVYVWTVNEPEDVDRCLELGVDALITDRPRHVMAQVRGAN